MQADSGSEEESGDEKEKERTKVDDGAGLIEERRNELPYVPCLSQAVPMGYSGEKKKQMCGLERA